MVNPTFRACHDGKRPPFHCWHFDYSTGCNHNNNVWFIVIPKRWDTHQPPASQNLFVLTEEERIVGEDEKHLLETKCHPVTSLASRPRLPLYLGRKEMPGFSVRLLKSQWDVRCCIPFVLPGSRHQITADSPLSYSHCVPRLCTFSPDYQALCNVVEFISCYTSWPWPPLWWLLLTIDCTLRDDGHQLDCGGLSGCFLTYPTDGGDRKLWELNLHSLCILTAPLLAQR